MSFLFLFAFVRLFVLLVLVKFYRKKTKIKKSKITPHNLIHYTTTASRKSRHRQHSPVFLEKSARCFTKKQMFLHHSYQSIVLLNFSDILSFSSKYIFTFSQNQYKLVAKSFNSCMALCNYIITICISITSILTTQVLLKPGDIDTNPGPKRSSAIQFCHWNLNGLADMTL